MGRLGDLLGAGVGLAAEAVAHRNRSNSPVPLQNPQRSSSSAEPPSYEQSNAMERSLNRSRSGMRTPDEGRWQSEKSYTDKALYDERSMACESSSAPGISAPFAATAVTRPVPLPLPVIIPQRRPEKKHRGFAICYPPSISQSGINQQAFLDFVLGLNEACQNSPYLDVINLAAIGVGFVPTITTTIIGFAVPVAVHFAKAAQTKAQSSRYLAKANAELFEPLGLYAMMTTYKPGQTSKVISMDVQSDESSGEQWQLPPSAPLVFFDEREFDSDKSLNQWQRSTRFMSDYIDRRSQAKYANASSGQSLQPPPTFSSRWGDPNHPATNGGLIGLVSGGLIQKPSKEDQKHERREGKRKNPGLIGTAIGLVAGDKGQPFQEHGLVGGVKSMALGEHANKGLIRGGMAKAMGENLIYLMIVNKPTNNAVATDTVYPEERAAVEPPEADPFYSTDGRMGDSGSYGYRKASYEEYRDEDDGYYEKEYDSKH